MERLTFRKLLSFFFRGLLFIIPVSLTIYILVVVVQWIDGLLGIPIPGLGLVVVLSSITLLGYLASFFITKPFFLYMEKTITRLPLISLIFTSLKDLIEAFVGDTKKFSKPVMVQLDAEGAIFKLGFITQKDLAKLELPGMVSVYLPHSYNFSGNHFVVKKDRVTPFKLTGSQAMKFIVSGGVSWADDEKNSI